MAFETVYHPSLNLVAYRLAQTDIHPLTITAEPPAGRKILSDLTVQQAAGGVLHIPAFGYIDMAAPGLYRLHSLTNQQSLQWVVYDNDTVTYAAAVASVFYHHADEPAHITDDTPETRRAMHAYVLQRMGKGQVAATCLTAASTFAFLAARTGRAAVVWQFDDPLNPFLPAASHAMAEVWDDASRAPILIDVDKKQVFAGPDGTLLGCADFVARCRDGRPIVHRPLSRTRYAGYGAPRRIPVAMDFLNDLHDVADAALQDEITRAVGRSLFVIGQRADGTDITPLAAREALQTRDILSLRASLDDTARLTLDRMLSAEIAAF